MSTAIVTQDVLDDVAFRLHLPAFSAGEFVSATEALKLYQGALGRLSGLLTRLYGDDLFAESISVVAQADVEEVSLPEDFHTLRSVHWVSGADAIELKRSSASHYDPTPRSWGAIDGAADPPTYALEGYVLRMVPAPTSEQTLRIAYTTTLTVASAATTIYGGVGWQEWLVNDMCERIRMREQKPFTEFTTARYEAEANIKEQATQRDRFAVITARDTRAAMRRSWQLARYRRYL